VAAEVHEISAATACLGTDRPSTTGP